MINKGMLFVQLPTSKLLSRLFPQANLVKAVQLPTSLRHDRLVKLNLYQRTGIRESVNFIGVAYNSS